MKSTEETAILGAWNEWAAIHLPKGGKGTKHSVTEGHLFYLHLKNARRELLDFDYKGPDRWQPVKAMLRRRGLIVGD